MSRPLTSREVAVLGACKSSPCTAYMLSCRARLTLRAVYIVASQLVRAGYLRRESGLFMRPLQCEEVQHDLG